MEKTKILALFNKLYGKNLSKRYKKLTEEFNELKEVIDNNNENNSEPENSKEFLENFVDELADVNAFIFHIAGILELTQDELLNKAVDKVVGRMKNPNYKRKHPHVNT